MVNNIELLVDAVLENDINLVKELLHKDINFDAIVRLSDINSEIYYVTFIQFLIENLYYRECDKNCEDDEDDYNKCKNITKLILQLFTQLYIIPIYKVRGSPLRAICPSYTRYCAISP